MIGKTPKRWDDVFHELQPCFVSHPKKGNNFGIFSGILGKGTSDDCILGLTIIPMDPSTFLGSVWGIIYYRLEG